MIPFGLAFRLLFLVEAVTIGVKAVAGVARQYVARTATTQGRIFIVVCWSTEFDIVYNPCNDMCIVIIACRSIELSEQLIIIIERMTSRVWSVSGHVPGTRVRS